MALQLSVGPHTWEAAPPKPNLKVRSLEAQPHVFCQKQIVGWVGTVGSRAVQKVKIQHKKAEQQNP